VSVLLSLVLSCRDGSERTLTIEQFNENGVYIEENPERSGFFKVTIDERKNKFPQDPGDAIRSACEQLSIDVIDVNAQGFAIAKLLPVIIAECSTVTDLSVLVYENGASVVLTGLEQLPLKNFLFYERSIDHKMEKGVGLKESLQSLHLEVLFLRGIPISADIIDAMNTGSKNTLLRFSCSKVVDVNRLFDTLLSFPSLLSVELDDVDLDEKSRAKMRSFKLEYERRYSRAITVMVMGSDP
jgi:hypothetical protein